MDAGRDTTGDAAFEARERWTVEEPARQIEVRLTFIGSAGVLPSGEGRLAHETHFLLGPDPSLWRAGAPSFREVLYRALYPGVDLVVRAGGDGELKYEFRVAPAANPSAIEVAFDGARALRITGDGSLVVETAAGELREAPPTAFLDGGGSASCGYALRGPTSYGFLCAPHDPWRTLVIDPLVYSTLLGGSSYERAWATAVDAAGDVYLAGDATSRDFPTTPGSLLERAPRGGNAFVVKLDGATGALRWATYLGGSGADSALAIAVDGAGAALVAGWTGSVDFPVTAGAFDTTPNNGTDAFVVRLAADGSSLEFGTYFGGELDDRVVGVAVDASGAVYLGGVSRSPNLPVTPGAPDAVVDLVGDSFVASLAADGSTLRFSTFLGGSRAEYVSWLAVDGSGSAYLFGSTESSDFPVTSGAFDPTHSAGVQLDGFVARLAPSGDALVYATYLGGAADDEPWIASLGADGTAYVVGWTQSADFPTTAGAFDRSYGGAQDGFVAALSPDGSALVASTFIGGGGIDTAAGVALSPSGSLFVGGQTFSSDFPVSPFGEKPSLGGFSDAFLTEWELPALRPTFSALLGGSSDDWIEGLGVDPEGRVTLVGQTWSADFPTTSGAADATLSGASDLFVAKFAGAGDPPSFADAAKGGGVLRGGPARGGTLFLGGASGGLVRTADGVNWTPAGLAGSAKAHFAAVEWNGALFASETDSSAGAAFSILRSVDGGLNWSVAVRDAASGPVDVFAIAPFGGYLFAASCSALRSGGSAALYRTADGMGWTVVNASFGAGVCSAQSMLEWRGALYLAVLDGPILRTADGVGWEQVASLPSPLTFVDGGQTLFVGTYRGGAVHKTADGATWTLHAPVPSNVETWAGDAWAGSLWWAGRAGSGPLSAFVVNLTGASARNVFVDGSGEVSALAFIDGRLVLANSRGEVKASAQVREEGPRIALSSNASAAGGSVAASLSGFAPNVDIAFSVTDGRAREVVNVALNADPAGEASFTIAPLASWTTGAYTVSASGESPERQLSGSYRWAVSSGLTYTAAPALVVELARAPLTSFAGGVANWTLRLTNNFPSAFNGLAAVSWSSQNLTPMPPFTMPVALPEGDSLDLELFLPIPANTSRGVYTCTVLVLTALPRDGGELLYSLDFTLVIL